MNSRPHSAGLTARSGIPVRATSEWQGRLAGVGIDPTDLPHLFDGFFQADATFARQYDGAGVGLAICRELTTLMGGEIHAVSRRGQGSTFTVRLPLQRSASVSPQALQAAGVEAESAADLRVLAAEDNPTNQLVLKTLLSTLDIEPVLASDGREAVEAWER